MSLEDFLGEAIERNESPDLSAEVNAFDVIEVEAEETSVDASAHAAEEAEVSEVVEENVALGEPEAEVVADDVEIEIESDSDVEVESIVEVEADVEDELEGDVSDEDEADEADEFDPEAVIEPIEAPSPTADVPAFRELTLAQTIEALLFLSPEPLSASQLADACKSEVGEVSDTLDQMEQDLAETRGIVLRRVSGGFALASAAGADEAARRLFAKPRTPPLTQAQGECLAIIAYLQPVSRPEVARIRGVSSESALGTLTERGLIADSGRTNMGAVIYRTTELFERLFGIDGVAALPDVAAFDPTPEDERTLRERLMKAGQAREATQV